MRGEGIPIFWFLVVLAGFIIAALIARSNAARANNEEKIRAKAQAEVNRLDKENANLKIEHTKTVDEKNFRIVALQSLLEQKKIQFPWLATAIADFNAFDAQRAATFLANKKHPAKKSAMIVREQGQKRREVERAFRIAQYKIDYYEKLLPWIVEYIGDDVPDSIVDASGTSTQASEGDPAAAWLTKAEYDNLTSSEKYQKALENWKKSRKTRWQIGRDYERYIGYIYETQGYDVEFTGAVQGYEDMGRDIIAEKGSNLLVIQCKYWSSEKIIREKHIFQLFGSALEYAFLRGKLTNLTEFSAGMVGASFPEPILYTSTKLSETAKKVADKLNVKFFEDVRISDYPMIKCNISMRDSEKIYHLPFDQQYDRTKIRHAGEMYLYTTAEAENYGFRRAWRWHPEKV
ncbi:MAG: restriction endonuclease [Xanthobacteraceae bacterium]